MPIVIIAIGLGLDGPAPVEPEGPEGVDMVETENAIDVTGKPVTIQLGFNYNLATTLTLRIQTVKEIIGHSSIY
jgi:hypothetical protein